MAPQSRRGKADDAATGEPVAIPTETIDRAIDKASDAVYDTIVDQAETHTAANLGEESPEVPIGTVIKVTSPENAARINTRRDTEWVDLTEVLGPKYQTPAGEPWKLLMIVDMTQLEQDTFNAGVGNYAASVTYANKFILMHNGWTDEDGELIPQPGDLIRVRTTNSMYMPALEESEAQPSDAETPILVPSLDVNGRQLYVQVVEEKVDTIPAAFWMKIPRKLVTWCMSEAWRRSESLPNLTKTPLSIISQQPSTNGKN